MLQSTIGNLSNEISTLKEENGEIKQQNDILQQKLKAALNRETDGKFRILAVVQELELLLLQTSSNKRRRDTSEEGI